ncbi:hypothetical protein H5410_026966 [Solanum commersonii]|uniref:DUF4283 domain-containing protein n=1 Tax=Solanum commersonii TaxID=4109 RepID=A0A9J5YYI8_SOLCO|nr:hypothetical protein H5410_026966 [Solanum commersonii]
MLHQKEYAQDYESIDDTPISHRLHFSKTWMFLNLLDIIEIATSSGTFQQAIDYEWRPSFCTECLQFGHTKEDCLLSNLKPYKEPFQEVPKKKKMNRRRKMQP